MQPAVLHSWLRLVESDLAPLNIGLATAYRRAQNRQAWSILSWEQLRSTPDKPHDDDDDDLLHCVLLNGKVVRDHLHYAMT